MEEAHTGSRASVSDDVVASLAALGPHTLSSNGSDVAPLMNHIIWATLCKSLYRISFFNFPEPPLYPPPSHHPASAKSSLVTVSYRPLSVSLPSETCLLGPTGVMGRGELCHPGKMSIVRPSFDPINTNSPVTFHNNLAR